MARSRYTLLNRYISREFAMNFLVAFLFFFCIFFVNSILLPSILVFTILAISWMSESGSYETLTMSSFPDSIFEKSRTSLIITRRFFPELRIW